MAPGSIAVLGGQGLGDNLLEMVLMENARQAGLRATMFSTRMCELSGWFPRHHLEPTVQAEAADHALAGFQLILFPKAPWIGVGKAVAENWVDYGPLYRKDANRAEDMARISGQVFDLAEPTMINGITPPASLQHRRYQRRICIHPTSAEISKNWLPQRFLALAARLHSWRQWRWHWDGDWCSPRR
jgi:heptosyltransferase-3